MDFENASKRTEVTVSGVIVKGRDPGRSALYDALVLYIMYKPTDTA